MNEAPARNAPIRPDMPTRVRGVKFPRPRPSLLFGRDYIRYDVMYADGVIQDDVDLNKALKGSRYPADYRSTLEGVRAALGDGVPGPWVDYPSGRRVET